MLVQPPPPPDFERAKSGLYVPRPTPPVLPYAVGMLGAAKAAFRQAAAAGGGGGGAVVENVSLHGCTGYGGQAITLGFTPTTGRVLVVLYGCTNDHTFGTPTGGGCTWTKQYGAASLSDSCGIATGIVGGSPSTSVTINYTATGLGGVAVVEVSGLDTGSLVDGSVQTGSGITTTTIGGTSITPTSSLNGILFRVCGISSNLNGGPAGSWTALMPYNGTGANYTHRAPSAYLIVSSASGSYADHWTSASGIDFTEAVIALKAA